MWKWRIEGLGTGGLRDWGTGGLREWGIEGMGD